jgi:hypothetical protein
VNESGEKLIKIVQEYKLGDNFETKVCLIRGDESNNWKVSVYTT